MHITLTQEKLAKGLTYVSRAVSNKPNIPVLSNVLLEVTRNDLRLSATNLDMGINMWIAGKVEEEGKVTASGKFLADFINATGEGKVEILLERDVLHVSTDTSKADFNTIPASEFPILPKAAGEPFFKINAGEFSEAMEKVIFASSTDLVTSKIQYTGVLFELMEDQPGKVVFTALDGYRLSHKTVKIDMATAITQQLIVPARSLQELMKIISSEGSEEVAVYLSESKSQMIFKFGDIEFSVRLLEGPYPDYKRVIPTEFAYSFDVKRSEFERALKIINTFARSGQGSRVDMDLDLETGTLTMRSKVAELGANETKLAVHNTSGSSDLKDAYSIQFLMDMVNHLKGETLHFETNAPLAPAVFTDKADKDYVHLVMPFQRAD